MHSFFKSLIIGHLLIYFNIYILFDWLPDFIGWIIIASSFQKLQLENKSDATVAKMIAYVLAAMSIATLFQDLNLISQLPTWLTILMTCYELISIIFYYYLFKVCIELAEFWGNVKETRNIKNIFLSVSFITVIGKAVIIHLPQNEASILSLILIFAVVPTNLLMIIYFFKMKNKRVNTLQ